MRFGPVLVEKAEGALLAHAIRRPGLNLKKGERIGADHIAALNAAGVAEIIVAEIEAGDVEENVAARRIARRLAGTHLRLDKAFTGRCNLIAERSGILVVDAAAIDRVNVVDESVTVATLPVFQKIIAGDMAATVKIIPFAISGAILDRAIASAGEAPLRIAPFQPLRVGVVSTLLPGLKASIVEKTLDALRARLLGAGATIALEERVGHETRALVGALGRIVPSTDLIIVFGASAITDRRDVIPSAIEKSGGRIAHFGMPVDPGNLLLIGHLPGLPPKPIIGAPGCARSPKENGFDFVLNRLLAGLDVGREDICRMGVGGLLGEIKSRPQPRQAGDG
ncbi:Molybdenum cofactor cytidylyltransferase [Methylocella tundrae]|uniref:Molybdenum cofactor cytidylyltransferase n=1 Tax=Methylocella tundrae TaxID=227605 RepID=A0A4U8YWC2_METTU|nr:Molybdenum cofactor cytidylyltransferase [Methylocella tundrae]